MKGTAKPKMKQEYNKKNETGWIGEQYCLNGNYIDRPEFGHGFSIYLSENDVQINLSKKQLDILNKMLKEFLKYVRTK